MPETKEMYLLGVSFRTAPAAVREALSFSDAELRLLLQTARTEMPAREAVVLSTCNRTEFYLAAPPDVGAVNDWLARLRRMRPNAPILRDECHRYQAQGIDVIKHLSRVACGLDSAILGDSQILGQVRRSVAIASSSGSLGAYLQRAFVLALSTGKRARHETAIGTGAVGIGSAIADLLIGRVRLNADAPTKIFIMGAGETARNVAYHLAKRQLGRLFFANRTEVRAQEVANQYGGDVRSWAAIREAVIEADIVIAATSATQPLLSRDLLQHAKGERPQRPLLVIDAGIPRNVEPGAPVELIDIDGVREQQEKTLSVRHAAVPHVDRIIDEEVQTWSAWHSSRPIEQSIKQLYLDAAHCRREMARHVAFSRLMPLDQADRIVWKSLRQVLHIHARRLRSLPTKTESALARTT